MASFFENQQLARRNTKLLVLMYALAVAAVIIAVDLVLGGLYAWNVDHGPEGRNLSLIAHFRLVPKSLYLWGAIGTAVVILGVSAWNVLQLADGGAKVAEMVGARRIASDTRDPLERRLVNVVEEMAIASGVRVPAVYVMDDEQGINAFAAGWDVSNSVVAVTRGTLDTLNRDELQGVIGHEFSHILHGDMRLNIRMIGVLAGIVFIGSIGEFLMRSVRKSRGKGAGGIFAAGFALLLIGYIGLFFARLIKAAVSREREFLADASSVQYTRNPDGIAGALDRIRAESRGTLIQNRRAEELSHMFFADSVKVWFRDLFDTHPPMEERIARVHPRFERSNYRKTRASAVSEIAQVPSAQGNSRQAAAAAVLASAALGTSGRRGADLGAAWGRSAGESAKLVGSLDGAKVDYAARLLAALPGDLRERLRDPEGARAALVALLFAPKEDVMKLQLDALAAKGMGALAEQARRTELLTRRLGPVFHLPVVDLALPALKQAPEETRRELVAALETAIHADRRVSLHEFVILSLVRSQLGPTTTHGRPGAAGNRRLAELQGAALIVLSLVAHAGTRRDATGQRGEALAAAMRAGLAEMGLPEAPAVGALTLETAAAALDALKSLAPLQKPLLVKGLFAAVSADGTIRVVEAELMRLVGAVLDCPLPPLLESIDPATLVA